MIRTVAALLGTMLESAATDAASAWASEAVPLLVVDSIAVGVPHRDLPVRMASS